MPELDTRTLSCSLMISVETIMSFWVRRKSKTFGKFKNEVENQLNIRIKVLWFGHIGKYLSIDLAWNSRVHTVFRFMSVEKTPYELWFGRAFPLSFLKIWECEAFMRKDRTSRKLDSRSDKVFLSGLIWVNFGLLLLSPRREQYYCCSSWRILGEGISRKKSSGSNVRLMIK